MRSVSVAFTFVAAALLQLAADARGAAGEGPPAQEGLVREFEREVRPILAQKCFRCHGEARQRGGLRLDSRAAILSGGDSGPAVVPGHPEESLLIDAVNYESIEMPPTGRLSSRDVAALTTWVQHGAVWPNSPPARGTGGGEHPSAAKGGHASPFDDEDRAWWAFHPARESRVPVAGGDRWSRNPVDRFVWRRLADSGLTPAPEADRATLIRRVAFDLTGLPPTPEEVADFVADRSPGAYEALVDRLLESPRYGERWARHWLDLVRYADSDGYRLDHWRPNAWLYRDYVIRSLNADKPYDRFVREQIAGDELYPDDPDALIATGYLRHWIYESNNLDVPGQWSLILNDITDTTGDVFLGLGIQCARCHDHKFDPILQKDYYRLQAFFAPILPRDDLPAADRDEVRRYRAALAAWESKTAGPRGEIARIEARHRRKAVDEAIATFSDEVEAMIRKPADQRTPRERQLVELATRRLENYVRGRLDVWIKGDEKARIAALRKQLGAFDREKPKPLLTPMAVTDVGPEAPAVFVPNRKDEPIAPGFLSILEEGPAAIRPVATAPRSTGRRAALAGWLTRTDNPLSTRVIVNRVWQHHFGRGLAAAPSDFGRLGEAPSHPELLDWLTVRFVREGWSLKRLHRLILTSATYRQSSIHPRSVACRLKDPENRLFWHANTCRLAAEQIRDAILAVTGELDVTSGGPGVETSAPRRSIYTRMMRNTRDPLLDAFDLPYSFSSVSSRDTTTTPLQSLFLLNSQAMLLRARAFAARLEHEAAGDETEMVNTAYRLAFGREPRSDERSASLRFLHAQTQTQTQTADVRDAGSAETAFLKGCLCSEEGQAALFSPQGRQSRLDVLRRGPLNTGPFTVEASFLARSVPEGEGVRTIVANWDGDANKPGWAFGISGPRGHGGGPTLVLQLAGTLTSGGFGEEVLFSDQPILLGRPYYGAVAVNLANDDPGAVTFYLKDLANDDEPLRVASLAHRITGGFGNSLPLSIGGQWGRTEGGFDGLIDEVRLSGGPLGVNELLVNDDARSSRALGYWRFEEEPGVFRDSTGHGLDLRLPRRTGVRAPLQRTSLVGFCHVLLNSSEFLYVD